MTCRRPFTNHLQSLDEWTAVDTPSSSSAQSGSFRPYKTIRQRQVESSIDSFAQAAHPAERKARRYELLIESLTAERDAANIRCQKAEAAACTENERFEEQMRFANRAAESARAKVNQEMALHKEKSLQVFEMIQSDRDRALQDLSEAKEQLAAIEMRGHDHFSCQEFHSLEHKNDAAQSQIKELEAERERLTRELEEAQESVTGYKNSFAITDKIFNEQQVEIAGQKTTIVAQEVENTRLKIRYGEMRVPDFSPENFVGHTGAVMHSTSGHPLVMRIDVLVDSTDAELALVKMNPDTPFKAVLEDLRRHHPLKALKQKDTGRYIFESDTPAHVSNLFFCRQRFCVLTIPSWASRTGKSLCLSSKTTSQISCSMLPWKV